MSIKQWWQARLQREKQILLASALILAGIVAYLSIEPLIIEKHRLRQALPALQQDLLWMQSKLESIRNLRAAGASTAAVGLSLSAVEQAIQQAGLSGALGELKPEAGEGIRAEFNEVPYSGLLSVLYTLRESEIARVGQLSIRAMPDKPGLVEASILFTKVKEP